MPQTRASQFIAVFLYLLISFSVAASLGQSSGYDQKFRPQAHFSPQEHWTNDPNGLVYFHGEYHLFYQFNPFGSDWGHMSWGHAVSKDLLHWNELPVAIPEHDGVMIFTGSIVVDAKNTSGLCAPGKECLVAVYTGFEQKQGAPRQHQDLAFSQDDGRTWTQFDRNPVLDLGMADFRDPSVSWDLKQRRWVMAVSLPKEHKIRFYASPNLRDWTPVSDFGPAGDVAGDWECPDLLQVPAANGHSPSMWALKVGLNPGGLQGGSGEQYFLGDFDGTTFTPSSAPGAHGWTNYGKDDYCAISFNGLPTGERPVLLGWMSNWQYAGKLPTSPWRGQMSLARRLSLVKDATGLALEQDPVVAPLRGAAAVLDGQTSSRSHSIKLATEEAPFEADVVFRGRPEHGFGLRLYSDDQHWTEITFDVGKREFAIDRTRSGLDVGPGFSVRTVAPLASNRPLDLKLIVDRSSIEAYAQDGTIAMTNLIYPESRLSRIELFSSSNGIVSAKGQIWPLHSIWNAEQTRVQASRSH